MKKLIGYFSKTELAIWSLSVVFITVSFILFDRSNYMTLLASLVGITALIFLRKGKSHWSGIDGCIQPDLRRNFFQH